MRSRRRGYTLVETLVVIAVLSVVLGSVTLSLHAMYRSARHMRDALARYQQLERLAIQFRVDVHQAVSATANNPDDPKVLHQLQLMLGDKRTVDYRLLETRIDRIVHNGGDLEHQDTYYIAPATTDPLAFDRKRPRTLVSLRLKSPVPGRDGESTAPVWMQLDAAVGLVHSPSAPGKS